VTLKSTHPLRVVAEGRLEAVDSRTIFELRRGLLICGLLGLALAPAAQARSVEVVVTLKQPPLAGVFAHDRSLAFSSFLRPRRLLLSAPASRSYLIGLQSAQRSLQGQIRAAIPSAQTRWSYGVVLNGFAVVVPQEQLARLARFPGIDRVWPSLRYRPLLDRTPQLIGAPTLWGPALATAGEGMKIAIVDDGIDQTHPFFAPNGYAYPPGFPKGQAAFTTPKVIVARAFPPRTPRYGKAGLPFDPGQSEHGTHVAGIAAGNNGTIADSGERLSGIAPRAYLGNYKALTIPTTGFGLNGNVPELAAAVEAAVRDGMDVINLSLGEPEVDPGRDVLAQALNSAADAGVASTVAAQNDFGEFGFGSVGSPASAVKTITAGASTGGHGSASTDAPASFSSAGPTSYSLRFKPDVTAPGTDVLSSLPEGSFGELSGTSMAAPHVAGAVALLRQRHPGWTPAQIKSALVLTGVPVRTAAGEVSPLREGGGRIDLAQADRPLVFAAPTNLSLGLLRAGATVRRTIRLTDGGGGAGPWEVQFSRPGVLSAPSRVTVPGNLEVLVAVPRALREQDVSGFLVLSREGLRRRIPFWLRVERPRLRLDRHVVLVRTGNHAANTALGSSRVSSYRYPDVPAGAAFPVRLSGPELVYRVRIRRNTANFGVAVIASDAGVRVEPRIVRAGDENRLAGYTALPLDLNPYRDNFGGHRLVAGVVLPAPGLYDVVFDTPGNGQAGGFRFRFWRGDTRPPVVRVLGVRGRFLELAVVDRGAGVDPASIEARIDGSRARVSYVAGRARISVAGLARRRHVLDFTVADYQETKNMENVARILPNTRLVRTTFRAP
jgi:subtilisin family serine protease